MTLRLFVLGGFLVLGSALAAAPSKLDILNVGSKTYTNVVILGTSATDLYFTHGAGIGNVKLKYLSADLQKQFNFDAKAAEAAEHKQVEDDKLYQRAVASSVAAQVLHSHPAEGGTNAAWQSLADPVADTSLLGKRAPALTVEKWLGPKPVLEGKAMLLAFWAPWSAPCRKYIPEWNTLQSQFATNLVVVGVCAEPEAKVVEMTEPKIEFASAIDTTSKLSHEAGVSSIPCVLLLDAKGKVLYQGHPSAITAQNLQVLLAKPAE